MSAPIELSRLQNAYAAVAERARSGDGCPEPERLWSAVRGEPDPETARRIGLHVVTCPACIEAWRLAREMAGDALPAEIGPTQVDLRRKRGAWWTLAAAAMLICASVVAFRVAYPPEPETRAYRATVTEPVRSLLDPAVPLARENCVLRWSGPGDARFAIRVATEDLSVLLEVGGLAEAEYPVPVEALAPVSAGERIIWQVEATLADGTRVASRTFVAVLE